MPIEQGNVRKLCGARHVVAEHTYN